MSAVVFPGDETAGSWNRIVQVLVGAAHFSAVEGGGVAQVEVHGFDRSGPARDVLAPTVPEPVQKAILGDVSAVIKGDVAVGYIDMVAWKGAVRDHAFGVKTGAWWAVQVDAREDVTGPMRKKARSGRVPRFSGSPFVPGCGRNTRFSRRSVRP